MSTRTHWTGRLIGVGIMVATLSAAESRAQYGPRANPITGVRTGLRYQPALPSPFASGGVATATGSRFGGFYGAPAVGVVGAPGFGFGYGGYGFGVPRAATVSGSFGFGGLGFRNVAYRSTFVGSGIGVGIGAMGYPSYGYGVGYGVPSLYGRYPYGSVGFSSFSYGVGSPIGGFGYSGFPYGYGYGYRGGYFGY